MRLVLMNAGKDIQATQDEKFKFVIAIASGKLDFPQIAAWIRLRIVEI